MSFIPQGTEKKSCKNAAIGKALEINDRENKNSRDFKSSLFLGSRLAKTFRWRGETSAISLVPKAVASVSLEVDLRLIKQRRNERVS